MAKQLIILCCVIAITSGAVKLKEFYSWKMLDWNFPDPFMKQQALQSGALIPQNALPVGIERWRNKLFVSVPRWRADSEYEPCYKLEVMEHDARGNYDVCEEEVTSENHCPHTDSDNVGTHTVSVLLPIPCLPRPKNSASKKENDIPSDILAVLGEAKNTEEILGQKIPAEIAERWGKILVKGLTKDQKEALLAKLLIPENFQLSKAPKLNAEVALVLSGEARDRDERLEKVQNQLGSGIAGIAKLTSELIRKDLNKIDIIRQLSETNQILLDLHYEETMNRRHLIIPNLDKRFINIIQGVKREKFLFGDNLSENIETIKSIEQSSAHIKKSIPPPTSTSRKPTTTGAQGNMKMAPRRLSGQGAARAPTSQAQDYADPLPPFGRRPLPATRYPPPPPLGWPQDRFRR